MFAARHLGLGFEEALAIVAGANKCRCKQPLDNEELAKIVGSAFRYDAAPPWTTDPIAFATDPALGSKERHLLITLARYRNHEGVCWPGIRRLRADTGMASNTIENATAKLVANTRITVVNQGRRKSKLYRLLDKPEPVPATLTTTSGTSVLHARTLGEGTAT